jgi:hypothetical protein
MDPSMSELDKWDKVHKKAVLLNEFFDFLNQKEITLCELNKDQKQFYLTITKRDDLIYEFFGINYDKLEQERRELLEIIRNA